MVNNKVALESLLRNQLYIVEMRSKKIYLGTIDITKQLFTLIKSNNGNSYLSFYNLFTFLTVFRSSTELLCLLRII